MNTDPCSERDLVKRGLSQFSLVEAQRSLKNCQENPDQILLTGPVIDAAACMY